MKSIGTSSHIVLYIITATVFFSVFDPIMNTTTTVLIVAVLAILSSALGGVLFFSNRKTDIVDPTLAPVTDSAVSADLGGARLITIGANSLIVDGGCSSSSVRVSDDGDSKWVWELHNVGTFNGKPMYAIESTYKNFDASCDKRWLTAPSGCRSAPYLASRKSGPLQHWMIYSSGSGYQIRNVSCVQGRFANSYLMGSGSNKNRRLRFSGGSGSTFGINPSSTGDAL